MMILRTIFPFLQKRAFQQLYLWRTARQQEIDHIEVSNGRLSAFEFKWNAKKAVRIPRPFAENYNAEFAVCNRDNLTEFVISSETVE